MFEKRTREYLNNEWVMEKEKELRDLQKKRGCGDRQKCKACTPLHVGSEFKAVEMQWVSSSQAQHINSIWCPLSYPCEEIMDVDEEELFMTLSTTPKAYRRSYLGNESLSNDEVSRQIPKFPRCSLKYVVEYENRD